MKLIKILGKTGFAITALMYAVCLFNDITLIEYSHTAEGNTLSIVGHSIEIDSALINALSELYTKANNSASELLPPQIKNAARQVSDLLSGG